MPDKTDIANRMKFYEGFGTQTRLMPKIPAMARLDGRAFHTLTKGLRRPYDLTLSELMIDLTKKLIELNHYFQILSYDLHKINNLQKK